MTNSYVSLDVFKGEGVMNIVGDGGDGRLLSLLENVSRMVDRYCNRHFYVLEAPRRFDGDGGTRLLLPDLVSIDEGGLRTDDDLDGVFETTWGAERVRAAAAKRRPGVARELWVAALHVRWRSQDSAGSERRWPAGSGTVQIAGQWGWWRRLRRAAGTVERVPDTEATAVAVSDRDGIHAGVTVLVDSEQMYVRSYSGGSLTVGAGRERHGGGRPMTPGCRWTWFEYPGPVVEAVVLPGVAAPEAYGRCGGPAGGRRRAGRGRAADAGYVQEGRAGGGGLMGGAVEEAMDWAGVEAGDDPGATGADPPSCFGGRATGGGAAVRVAGAGAHAVGERVFGQHQGSGAGGAGRWRRRRSRRWAVS